MATINIDDNFYVTTGTISGDTISGTLGSGGDTVKITIPADGSSIIFDLAKTLTVKVPSFQSPNSQPSKDSSKPEPSEKLGDLNVVEDTVKVLRGILEDEVGDLAIDKFNNLRRMAKAGGPVSIVTGTGVDQIKFISGSREAPFFEKVSIVKTGMPIISNNFTSGTEPKKFNLTVDLSFRLGEDVLKR